MEDGQEAAHDQVIDAALVVIHLVDRMALRQRRDDRVVVSDLLIVDNAAERQRVESGDVRRRGRVLLLRTYKLRDRLDVGDHVAGDEAQGVGSRIGERLVLLIERLRSRKRAARGEAKAARRLALQ